MLNVTLLWYILVILSIKKNNVLMYLMKAATFLT